MPVGTFFVYDFTEGTTQFADNATDTTLSFTSGGLNFTFSVNDPAGLNSIAQLPSTGVLEAGAGSTATQPPQDAFTLDLTDPNQNFTGTAGQQVALNFDSVSGQWIVTFHQTGGATTQVTIGNPIPTATDPGGTELYSVLTEVDVATQGTFSHITFTPTSQNGYLVIDDIAANVSCFAEGTRIETETGPARVEDLAEGARLRTADGALTTVTWVGHTRVGGPRADAGRTTPVRIPAGALGDGLPRADLWLSADHAVVLDGHLVNAGALADGDTIRRDRARLREGFTYYHVETEGGHELILAEGVAAETYLEHLAPQSFDNARDAAPRVVREMDMPRITSARLLPAPLRSDSVAA